LPEGSSRCLLVLCSTLLLLDSILYECMYLNNGERGPTTGVCASIIRYLFDPTFNILDQLHHLVQFITSHIYSSYVGHNKGYTASKAMQDMSAQTIGSAVDKSTLATYIETE
jgi:hypothetical protein